MPSECTTQSANITGGCQCGAIRYALSAAPEGSVCHCRMCQKATGGLFAALASVKIADLRWTRGQPATFRSSSIAARDFCRDCGTPLAFRFINSDTIELTIGSLDEPAAAAPRKNFGVESRLPWIADLVAGRLADVITGTNWPAGRVVISHQHPDHDTPGSWSPHSA